MFQLTQYFWIDLTEAAVKNFQSKKQTSNRLEKLVLENMDCLTRKTKTAQGSPRQISGRKF